MSSDLSNNPFSALDPTMLEMFLSEAATQSQALVQAMDKLAGDPDPETLNQAMIAAQGLESAAAIVGLSGPADLAGAVGRALEWVIAQPDRLLEIYGPLMSAGNWFAQAANIPAGDFSAWGKDQEVPVLEMAAALADPGASLPQECALQTPAGDHAPVESLGSPAQPEPSSPALAPGLDASAQASMMELFGLEAREQAAILETGLVEAEESAVSGSALEPLMRAAHSIKGAARIVGLDLAVELAHAMEDLLVACQEGKAVLTPQAVDSLLHGVDLFAGLGAMAPVEMAPWLAGNERKLQDIRKSLRHILEGGPLPDSSGCDDPVPSTARKPLVSPPAEEKSVSTQERRAGEGTVRVTAQNLSQLMGLAGQMLVEVQKLQTHSQALAKLKNKHWDLAVQLDNLIHGDSAEPGQLEKIRETARACSDGLIRSMDDFEGHLLGWENLSNRLYNQTIASRMRPLADGIQGFSRMVRDLARNMDKQIKFEVVGSNTLVDRDILSRLEAPLNHLVRNACDHGMETPQERKNAGKQEQGRVSIIAGHRAGMLSITVADDGDGVNLEALRQKVVEKGLAEADMAAGLDSAELLEFLFLPGFSTAGEVTEISGRGVGLDVVRAMAAEVGGTVKAESEPGKGTRFHLSLPLTLSVIRTLLVEIDGEPFAFPMTKVDRVLEKAEEEISRSEDRLYVSTNGKNLGLVWAHQALGLKRPRQRPEIYRIIQISDNLNRYGLIVDRLLGENVLVVHPLDRRLGKVPNVYAAAVGDDGAPVLILDADDLVRSIDRILGGQKLWRADKDAGVPEQKAKKRLLVVDDSITVRETQKKILENAGYLVDTAVDGMDGFNRARSGRYDLVVSDVDMPRLNGIQMIQNIRADAKLSDLPVIIVSYKDRQQDRLDGLAAGANHYLTKSSFFDESFLQAVRDLAGKA